MGIAIKTIDDLIKMERKSSIVYVKVLNGSKNQMSFNVFIKLLSSSQKNILRLMKLRDNLANAEVLNE